MNEDIKAHWEKYYGAEAKLGATQQWYYIQPDPGNDLYIILIAYKMSYLRYLDDLVQKSKPKTDLRSARQHLVSLSDDTWVYPFTTPNSPLTEEMMLRMLKLKAFL